MRVIDKNAPTDIDKFWFALGELRVMAAIKGQSDEVVIEEKAAVCDALNAAGAAEAGHAAFSRGINQKLDEMIAIDAWAMKNKRTRVSWIKSALAAHVAAATAPQFTVRPEPRTLRRKTVEEFDADGRILSMLEEEIKV